jgi:hypothetical protein
VYAEETESFTVAGFGTLEQESLSYTSGIVHSLGDYYSSSAGSTNRLGPFILGTSQTSRGDSGKDNDSVWSIKHKTLGGGCWSSRGLIGMNLGITMMPSTCHELAISEAATFSPKNIICQAFRLEKAYRVCL